MNCASSLAPAEFWSMRQGLVSHTVTNPPQEMFTNFPPGSRSIFGVEDTKLYPIRGQTVTVNAPAVQRCHAMQAREFLSHPRQVCASIRPPEEANGEITYIIPRPSATGSVLLGGTYQADNWDTSIDLGTAARIIERCSKLEPTLLTSDAQVVSHQVGLRPAREGGPRVERELVRLPIQSVLLGRQHDQNGEDQMRVVHSYGFG
jgi:D-amino-acid oxidase